MRIAIMLRSLDEKGGIGIYTRFLVEHLISLDPGNTYLLFYKSKSNLGRYSHHKNVEEYFLSVENKFFWDQIAVPYTASKQKADVIINPKFTLPLLTRKRCIVVQHGADWFLPECTKFYKLDDIIYNRIFIRLYCKKADFVISVSKFSTTDFIDYVKVPPEKMRTIYFGPADFFRRISDISELERVKRKYNLPDKFILTLSRYGFGGGNRKNINTLLEAYRKYYNSVQNPVKLVVGGKNVERYVADLSLEKGEYLKNIQFTGWIEQEDLPSIYSLSQIYLYPSNLETFPIPITEAMACGTPIITTNKNGMKEIAGEAALFVNNKDPEEISLAIQRLLSDDALRRRLADIGLQRARSFNWNSCTREILDLINTFDNSYSKSLFFNKTKKALST